MHFCGNLRKEVGFTPPPPPPPSPIPFLKGVECKFWVTQFCENTENKFNKSMAFITHFVFLYAFLRTQMLLRSRRHQVINSLLLLYFVLNIRVKDSFSYNNKVKNKTKHQISGHFQHCFVFMLHFRVYNHEFPSLFLNYSTLLFRIDLEISPCCMVNLNARALWTSRKMGVIMLFSR